VAYSSFGYLSSFSSSGGLAGWALLLFAVLGGVASGLRRAGRWLAAGIFAFATVAAFAAFVGALWYWIGWLNDQGDSPFSGFHLGRLALELLVLLFGASYRRRFAFPFIALLTLTAGWLLVTDLVSGGGTWSAVVTLLVALVYLAAGTASDRPASFWLHTVSGVLLGGSLLYWWHAGDWHWALVAVASLGYVRLAVVVRRSSWAVLGAAGLLAAATHYAYEWTGNELFFTYDSAEPTGPRFWVPLVVYAVVGFGLVVLGLLVGRALDSGARPTST
jgi:hypothetical protein